MFKQKKSVLKPKYGRGSHFHRKLALDRYVRDSPPPRGLGLHRLPTLARREHKPLKSRDADLHPAIWVLVLVAITVLFSASIIMCLALINLIRF
jgi:hypothetical protein